MTAFRIVVLILFIFMTGTAGAGDIYMYDVSGVGIGTGANLQEDRGFGKSIEANVYYLIFSGSVENVWWDEEDSSKTRVYGGFGLCFFRAQYGLGDGSGSVRLRFKIPIFWERWIVHRKDWAGPLISPLVEYGDGSRWRGGISLNIPFYGSFGG